MKRSLPEHLLRLALLLVGLTIAHLGVTLFLLSDLGSDPFNVLVQGLFTQAKNATNWAFLTHGRMHVFICLLILVVVFFVDRSYVKIGAIVCMICGGPIIDVFTALLEPVLGSGLPIWGRGLMLVAGCVILAYGMTIVMKSDCGVGPNDLVAIVTADKLKKKFPVVRVIVDAAFALIGWALGGVLGVGTLVCAFLVGPVAGIFLPINEKLVSAVLRACLPKAKAE